MTSIHSRLLLLILVFCLAPRVAEAIMGKAGAGVDARPLAQR